MNTTLGKTLLFEQRNFLLLRDRFKQVGKITLFSIILFVFLINTNLICCSQTKASTSLQVDSQLFDVERHSTKIDVLSIDEINVAERYTVKNIQNSSLNSIEIWVNQTAANLIVRDFDGTLVFETNEISVSSNLLTIHFRSELAENSSTTFDIWYSLSRYPVAEQGNSHYFFEFYSGVTYFTKEHIIEIKIPERSFIHEEEGLISYFPVEGFALAGKRVYISWTFNDLEPFEQSLIFVRFEKPLQKTPILAIILGPTGGVILGVCSTILFMKRREKKVVKKISTIYLSDTQKTLLNLISKNNGKILQKELCAETGYTKSRISRNITPLVEQGLVKRDKWGRNYVIRLTENGRKVVE